MLAENRVYRFSDYVLDVEERCLKRDSRQVYLQPKTFATLLYLIQRQGHLVSKDELLSRLWPDAEVTESSLTRCIKDIREALEDDVRNPQYIKTVPRVGYKFIAQVEAVRIPESLTLVQEEFSATKVEVLDEVSPENPSVQGISSPAIAGFSRLFAAPGLHGRRAWVMAGVISLAVIAVAGGTWYRIAHPKPALGFAERDWVLIADFENLTGEKAFDAALRTALERELSCSAYVNYVPPARVVDTLTLMKRDPDTRIDEAVGREVCLRDGNIRGLLLGSIQQLGGSYALNLKVVDPRTGVTVNTLAEDAANIQEVLPAIRRLSTTVRERLGESLVSISKSDQELGRVTTPSIQALEAFSKGMNLYERSFWPQSMIHFDRAIELDPAFAMAYWARGRARHWVGQPGLADLNRAAELVNGVTDREKHIILAAQALHCSGDFNCTVDILERMLQLYPDDHHANHVLSFPYLAMGDWPGYRRCAENCQRIRPNFSTNHFENALIALLVEGDPEKYHSESLRVLALDPNYPAGLPHVSDPFRDWMRGDLTRAEGKIADFRAAKMSALGPSFQISVRPFLARFYLFLGKSEVALELFETTRGMAPRESATDFSRLWRLERALIYRQQGNVREFSRLVRDEASESVGLARVEALGWLGIAAAQSGSRKDALAYRDELQKETRLPEADLLSPPLPRELERGKRAFSLQIEGEAALEEGKIEEAIPCFTEVVQLVPPQGRVFSTTLQPQLFFVANESLASAFGRKGDWKHAAQALEDILAHKVLTVRVPGASQIWLRALGSISEVLEKAGDNAKAAAYRDEFHRLKSFKQQETSEMLLPSRSAEPPRAARVISERVGGPGR
jgi:DNA-binding winged helix-turn-helix (wHTH) protein/tetratricopeptide (TPR) repeat protein